MSQIHARILNMEAQSFRREFWHDDCCIRFWSLTVRAAQFTIVDISKEVENEGLF